MHALTRTPPPIHHASPTHVTRPLSCCLRALFNALRLSFLASRTRYTYPHSYASPHSPCFPHSSHTASLMLLESVVQRLASQFSRISDKVFMRSLVLLHSLAMLLPFVSHACYPAHTVPMHLMHGAVWRSRREPSFHSPTYCLFFCTLTTLSPQPYLYSDIT
jgi:hypothetical protein